MELADLQDRAVQNQEDDADPESIGPYKYNQLFDFPGFLVRRLWQIHVAMFLEEVEGAVTPVQFSILLVLHRKCWLEQGRVAVEVGIDRSNAADILPRMEHSGLIQRKRSKQDRRVMLVGLTDAGLATFEIWRERVEHSHDRMLEALPSRQRAVFIRMLQRIVVSRDDLD